MAVSSKHPYAEPIRFDSIGLGYILWLQKFIEKYFAFNFGFRNDFTKVWQYQRLCKCRGRGELFVLRRKWIQVSLWQTNRHAFVSFWWNIPTSLRIQIKFLWFSHLVLGVSIAINAYPRNIIVINTKVIRIVFTTYFNFANEMPLFIFLTNYRRKNRLKQSSKTHVTQKIAPMHRTNWTVKWPMRVKHEIPHSKMHEHFH